MSEQKTNFGVAFLIITLGILLLLSGLLIQPNSDELINYVILFFKISGLFLIMFGILKLIKFYRIMK